MKPSQPVSLSLTHPAPSSQPLTHKHIEGDTRGRVDATLSAARRGVLLLTAVWIDAAAHPSALWLLQGCRARLSSARHNYSLSSKGTQAALTSPHRGRRGAALWFLHVIYVFFPCQSLLSTWLSLSHSNSLWKNSTDVTEDIRPTYTCDTEHTIWSPVVTQSCFSAKPCFVAMQRPLSESLTAEHCGPRKTFQAHVRHSAGVWAHTPTECRAQGCRICSALAYVGKKKTSGGRRCTAVVLNLVSMRSICYMRTLVMTHYCFLWVGRKLHVKSEWAFWPPAKITVPPSGPAWQLQPLWFHLKLELYSNRYPKTLPANGSGLL